MKFLTFHSHQRQVCALYYNRQPLTATHTPTSCGQCYATSWLANATSVLKRLAIVLKQTTATKFLHLLPHLFLPRYFLTAEVAGHFYNHVSPMRKYCLVTATIVYQRWSRWPSPPPCFPTAEWDGLPFHRASPMLNLLARPTNTFSQCWNHRPSVSPCFPSAEAVGHPCQSFPSDEAPCLLFTVFYQCYSSWSSLSCFPSEEASGISCIVFSQVCSSWPCLALLSAPYLWNASSYLANTHHRKPCSINGPVSFLITVADHYLRNAWHKLVVLVTKNPITALQIRALIVLSY
jgi:hypothetical protein